MTKKNLLLVSLFLVLGLAASAPTLFGAVTFNLYWSEGTPGSDYDYPQVPLVIRQEGDAEAVNSVELYSESGGAVASPQGVTIGYNVPLATNGTTYAIEVAAFNMGTCTWTATPSKLPSTNAYINAVFIQFSGSCTLPDDSGFFVTVRVQAEGLTYAAPNVDAQVKSNSLNIVLSPTYPQTDPADRVAVIGNTAAVPYAIQLNWKQSQPTPAEVLTCIGPSDWEYKNKFSLRITESWPWALTSVSDEYYLESDTFIPAPSNGGDILITFSNVPTGLRIVPKTLEDGFVWTCSDGDPSKDPHGCPGTTEYPDLLCIQYTTSSTVPGLDYFYYTVLKRSGATAENAVFDFNVYGGPLPPGLPPIEASINLTDALPSYPGIDMPYFTILQTVSLDVVEFNDCVTNLLFPYINAYVGDFINKNTAPFDNFGTGINVANTTADPFGLPAYPFMNRGSAVPQAGSCTFYFYWQDETSATWTTPTITSGGSYAFDVSHVLSIFDEAGYAIAICNFQNAWGFAEIYDNAYMSTPPTATLGYLAVVLPNPAFYPRSPAGDALGEGAPAPINYGKYLRYYLGEDLKIR